MAKTKSMGTEYKIITKGSWKQVAEAARILKGAIEDTQPRAYSFSMNNTESENRVLKGYLVPKDGENFADYKSRFIQAHLGTGLKGKLALLLSGNEISFDFELALNSGESRLKIKSIARELKYQSTIGASGDYSERGASIAAGLKKALEKNSVKYSYNTLDRLI